MKKAILICLAVVLVSSLSYATTVKEYLDEGVLYYNQKDYDNALESFQSGFRKQQSSGRDPAPLFYLNIGTCYLQKGNYI